MTLTVIFLQFFFTYTVTITDHFGSNYIQFATSNTIFCATVVGRVVILKKFHKFFKNHSYVKIRSIFWGDRGRKDGKILNPTSEVCIDCALRLLMIFPGEVDPTDIDKFLRDTANRWHTISMELFCTQNMLEEVVTTWKQWRSTTAELENWIEKSSCKVNLMEEEKNLYFQVVTRKLRKILVRLHDWQNVHTSKNSIYNFLRGRGRGGGA